VMLDTALNAGFSTQKGGAKLGDEFFHGVGVITKTALQIAIAAAGVAGPVGQLVEIHGVKVFGILEALPVGHVDFIVCRAVESTGAAFNDAGAAGFDQGFGGCVGVPFVAGWGCIRNGQAVDLFEVKNTEGLSKSGLAGGFVAVGVGVFNFTGAPKMPVVAFSPFLTMPPISFAWLKVSQ